MSSPNWIPGRGSGRSLRPGALVISENTFDQIDDWIRAAEETGRNVRYGMDTLAMLMARTNQAIAMEMSRGPNDPQQRQPDLAWKIPVRRITSRYYKGWKVKRVAPGAWLMYNMTREAYFIEFGINHVGQGMTVTYRDGRTYIKSARRVRRPIRKLSLIKTLKHIDRTKAGERVWEQIFAPFRPGQVYHRGRGGIRMDEVQSMSGMRNI
jgi:hypothetical protein